MCLYVWRHVSLPPPLYVPPLSFPRINWAAWFHYNFCDTISHRRPGKEMVRITMDRHLWKHEPKEDIFSFCVFNIILLVFPIVVINNKSNIRRNGVCLPSQVKVPVHHGGRHSSRRWGSFSRAYKVMKQRGWVGITSSLSYFYTVQNPESQTREQCYS